MFGIIVPVICLSLEYRHKSITLVYSAALVLKCIFIMNRSNNPGYLIKVTLRYDLGGVPDIHV